MVEAECEEKESSSSSSSSSRVSGNKTPPSLLRAGRVLSVVETFDVDWLHQEVTRKIMGDVASKAKRSPVRWMHPATEVAMGILSRTHDRSLCSPINVERMSVYVEEVSRFVRSVLYASCAVLLAGTEGGAGTEGSRGNVSVALFNKMPTFSSSTTSGRTRRRRAERLLDLALGM